MDLAATDLRYVIVAAGTLLIAAVVIYHVARTLAARRRTDAGDDANTMQADDAGALRGASDAAGGRSAGRDAVAAPLESQGAVEEAASKADEAPPRRTEPRIAAASLPESRSDRAMTEADETVSEPRPLPVRPAGQGSDTAQRTPGQRDAAGAPAAAEVEEFVAIWVAADEGERFGGESLISAFKENNLDYGDRNVFHRLEGSVTQFMVVNGIEPGTFDLSDVSALSTPAIVLLLPLPGPPDPPAAFQAMLNAARALERALGGSLRDENRNAMSLQTIEHSRNRVNEFSRKQMSVRS